MLAWFTIQRFSYIRYLTQTLFRLGRKLWDYISEGFSLMLHALTRDRVMGRLYSSSCKGLTRQMLNFAIFYSLSSGQSLRYGMQMRKRYHDCSQRGEQLNQVKRDSSGQQIDILLHLHGTALVYSSGSPWGGGETWLGGVLTGLLVKRDRVSQLVSGNWAKFGKNARRL